MVTTPDESVDPGFWYDAQIRRYLMQFARVFGSISIRMLDPKRQTWMTRRVPIRLALTNRQVAHILRQSNENVALVVPMMTVAVTGMAYNQSRVFPVQHVERTRIYERGWDREKEEYTAELGQSWTLTRYMPVPYDMTVELSVWTSNIEQKLQIFEQIAVMFNPSVEIQGSDSPYDWGSLSIVTLSDVNWTTTNYDLIELDNIEILTMTFNVPIWITAPAKLEENRSIHHIIQRVLDADTSPGADLFPRDILVSVGGSLAEVFVTDAIDNWIEVDGTDILLRGPDGETTKDDGTPWSWEDVLKPFGAVIDGSSEIYLLDETRIETPLEGIRGTLQTTPDPNRLIWSPDPTTLPVATLAPVDAVIDPLKVWPGNGLPVATDGTRYLVTSDVGPNSAWGSIDARAGDIVEYNGGIWLRPFVAANRTGEHHWVLNQQTGELLAWNGKSWTSAVSGEYPPGLWRIALRKGEPV